MKRKIPIAFLLAALAAPLLGAAQDPQDGRANPVYPAEPVGSEGGAYDVAVDLEGGAPVSISTFEAPLGSYGEWVSVGGYGNVWRPRVPVGWRPYYYGRWEWTTEGWLWVSDEPFGWATYHYGRWTFDRGYGWLWIPGFQWAPAWVTWRYSGDVVGWAPLAPGLSLYVTDFAFVDFWWTFVPTGRFCGMPVYGAAYPPGHARRWYDATRPAPPRPAPPGGYRPAPGRFAPPAWGGPGPRFVEERAARPIHPYRIVPTATPGGGRSRPGEIGVYRPESRPPRGQQPSGWEQRGRGPGAGVPPGSGWAPLPGASPGQGRSTGPVPAPGFERGWHETSRPSTALPARAPTPQPAARPAPESRPAPPPPATRGEDRGHQGGGRGDRR
jgi:hypothetical protein